MWGLLCGGGALPKAPLGQHKMFGGAPGARMDPGWRHTQKGRERKGTGAGRPAGRLAGHCPAALSTQCIRNAWAGMPQVAPSGPAAPCHALPGPARCAAAAGAAPPTPWVLRGGGRYTGGPGRFGERDNTPATKNGFLTNMVKMHFYNVCIQITRKVVVSGGNIKR